MKRKPTILFFVLFLSSFPQERTVYIAKNYWHTGIIIPTDTQDVKYLPVLKNFEDSKFVDIGMGEKEFYMSPSRDIVPAAKAILIPTDATIRIAEVPGDTSFLRRTSDFLLEMKFDTTSFNKLLKLIDSSLTKNNEGKEVVIESRAGGSIIFYECTESYHLFNTCNTWLARVLEFAGVKIAPGNVITSKELFRELLDKARVIKYDTTDTVF